MINEIYNFSKFENGIDSSIRFISNTKYSNGITKESFEVIKRVNNQDKGHYTIINSPTIPYSKDDQITLIKKLTEELNKYLSNIDHNNVLVVGLGNRHISADSLGSKVVKNIIVTRHIENLTTLNKVSAIAPSVLGLTGIESFDIISSVVNKIKPDLVIAIDSLCASSHTRLGTSFQINNSSIVPGGGVNNARVKLSSNSLGTNFISVGVPLVIYANTLSYSNMEELNNMIVTLKDIEDVSNITAKIISYSVNMSIHNLKLSEVKEYLNKI